MIEDSRRKAFGIAYPSWVPEAAARYLIHTEHGASIREIARHAGCHASTILRQIRRYETRRDDPLIDGALTELGAGARVDLEAEESTDMMAERISPNTPPDEATIAREARRILRRLAESGAVLAAARDMEKAVVVRDTPDGRTTRTAVVDRQVAQAMALKDWISVRTSGRITRYAITDAGRAALKRLIDEDRRANRGGDDSSPFANQHRSWAERDVVDEDADAPKRRVRYNLAESPLTALSRRRDRDGQPFLSAELVSAGERLREDFELAQMGPRVTQNWDNFLTGCIQTPPSAGNGASGPSAARARVSAALRDLGPGLGDVALRCCCFLEGMETTEKRLGWSARSGKIVLRIALQRLRRHYDETEGRLAPMIG